MWMPFFYEDFLAVKEGKHFTSMHPILHTHCLLIIQLLNIIQWYAINLYGQYLGRTCGRPGIKGMRKIRLKQKKCW